MKVGNMMMIIMKVMGPTNIAINQCEISMQK